MIDGLRPNYNDGSWPSCYTKTNFDEKLVHLTYILSLCAFGELKRS